MLNPIHDEIHARRMAKNKSEVSRADHLLFMYFLIKCLSFIT